MQYRIHRRALLESLLVLPVGVFLVRCSSSSTNNTPPAPAANPTVSGSQAIFTSSLAQDHSHTFNIPITDFINPPSGGLSGDTSSSAEHTHHVSIALSEFQAMQTGSSVAITTSLVSGHTHVFTFVKLSAIPKDGGVVPKDGGVVSTKDGGLVTP
jgi:hypothetical protein